MPCAQNHLSNHLSSKVGIQLMHLIPTGLLLGALAIAWRWEWVGALLLFGLGAAYAIMARTHPVWIVLFTGPLFLVGGLFLLNWRYRA